MLPLVYQQISQVSTTPFICISRQKKLFVGVVLGHSHEV